jgi:hypothetical protein
MKPNYHKIENKVVSFQEGEEPELIHIIKSGFEDRYIVVFEDAYEMALGQTEILNKAEIEIKFKITL